MRYVWLVCLLLLLPACQPASDAGAGRHGVERSDPHGIAVADLPPEAQQTLHEIERGGPFAYARDGVVFGNYEHELPKRPRGYYHEYTVRTPGKRNRGIRRIVAGGAGEYYYSPDHYQTFRRIQE